MEFNDALAAFVCEMIPSDDLPGAREAGTADGVRAVLAAQPALALLAERGFAALDRAAERLGGQPFAALPPLERQRLLAALARGSQPAGWTAADPRPELFWTTLRGLAIALFYGSPAGRQVTGFPGPVVDRGGYRHNIVDPTPATGSSVG